MKFPQTVQLALDVPKNTLDFTAATYHSKGNEAVDDGDDVVLAVKGSELVTSPPGEHGRLRQVRNST